MSDQLPVAGGSGRDVVPASIVGDLTSHQGDSGSLARTEPGRSTSTAASAANTGPLASRLNELAGHLHLSDSQLQAYRAWMVEHHEQLGEALEEWALEEQIARDQADLTEMKRVLRAEWGASYEANIARIKGWLATLPAPLSEAILQGRYFGGQAICNDPDVMRALLKVSATAAGSSAPSSADADRRVLEIQALMANLSSEYWKGPRANAIQAEYRELLDLQQQRRS
ncbi:MAG: hypothetical protein ACREVO_08135 [Steroidobacteraceae bacterium]